MRAALLLVVVGSVVLGPLGGSARAQHARAHYVVAPGDTLTAIAERYDISMSRLARANGLNWRKPLLVGTNLHIPGMHASFQLRPSRWKNTYVVRAGDTLGALAARYGVSLPKFAKVNGIDWQAPLLVGAKLHIPGTRAAPKAKSAGWTSTYIVQAGDTLSAIATRYGISLADLAGGNKIDPAGVLLEGEKLHVPGSAPTPHGVTITVQPGDTLSAIAGRYGLSLTSLVDANRISLDAPLLVGQRLVIPGRVGFDSALLTLTRSQTSPYVRGSAGLDVSYPGCGHGQAIGAFTVVGLNDGRPFTLNPCFAAQYAAAAEQAPPSVYVNSAYGRSMLGQIASDCAADAATLGIGWRQERAYALGCSEAEAVVAALAATRVSTIWVDVESANTWSTDSSLNRATLEGMLVTLLNRQSSTVGVYASPRPWEHITGSWSLLSLPEWVATGPPGLSGCTMPFATGPVWLSQSTPDLGQHDDDLAC